MNVCQHLNVTVYVRLATRATRDQPAEYVDDSAKCNDCGAVLHPDELNPAARVDVEEAEKPMRGVPHEFYD